MHILGEEEQIDTEALRQSIAKSRISVLEIDAREFKNLVCYQERVTLDQNSIHSLRWLIVCCDFFSKELYNRWDKVNPGIGLLYRYFSTLSCTNFIDPSKARPSLAGVKSVPISLPADYSELFILDDWMQPVPIGVPGLLYYKERRQQHCAFFSQEKKNLMNNLVSTGDLACLLPDTSIEILEPNKKRYIKYGVTAVLGEVEEAMSRHPAAQESVVTVSRDDDYVISSFIGHVVQDQKFCFEPVELRYLLGKILPEYMLPPILAMIDGISESQLRLTENDVRYFLARFLPGDMVPDQIMIHEQLPHTPEGKIDLVELQLLVSKEARIKQSRKTPQTPTEATLGEIWSELLGVTEVGVEDNFFRLGGSSLLATQLVIRVRERFEIELSTHSVFEKPTVEGLAARIDLIKWSQENRFSSQEADWPDREQGTL